MGNFFKFFSWFLVFPLLGLRAETPLDSLIEYDGQTIHKIEGHIMNVLCVPAAFPPRPYGTNMYIIWCKDTHDAVIVDPGTETFKMVLEAVRQYSLNPVAIWITHSHWDHIVDAAKIKREFSLPIFMHEEDRGNLENPGSDGVPMAVPTIERSNTRSPDQRWRSSYSGKSFLQGYPHSRPYARWRLLLLRRRENIVSRGYILPRFNRIPYPSHQPGGTDVAKPG